MILLAGFLEVLFRGLVFVGLALAVGGIAFRAVVLAPSAAARETGAGLRRNARLIALGAAIILLAQLVSLAIATWSLADENGRWPLALVLSTGFARAALARAILAAVLALAALGVARRPRAWGRGAALLAPGALVLASGAWLAHGASRLEQRGVLMAVTVIHQLAVATWVGGVLHLVAQWRLLRASERTRRLWPELPARFSPLALVSVAGLALAGFFLSIRFVGDFAGLVGTAYGTMLLTKIVLTGVALAFGGMNFLALRERQDRSGEGPIYARLPVFIETEAAIGIIILLAAAAFTSQPPAVDTVAQRASPAEVAHVFAPKRPQLVPAPLARLNANATSPLDPFVRTTGLDRIQSDFNHNVSGVFVLLIGLAAFLHGIARSRVTRHWPLLFLPFWLFLAVFAAPTGWPLGRKGFWESLSSVEVLQHRMGTLLVLALGILEWRVQLGRVRSERWRKAFPMLCFAGGALLLPHTHSLTADKSAYLIEVSHDAIGILAVLIGALSWLELRASGRIARAAAVLWPIFFVGVGWVLMAYQEV